eukprot:12164332-Alexandrium_andersonii.AAC.1
MLCRRRTAHALARCALRVTCACMRCLFLAGRQARCPMSWPGAAGAERKARCTYANPGRGNHCDTRTQG